MNFLKYPYKIINNVQNIMTVLEGREIMVITQEKLHTMGRSGTQFGLITKGNVDAEEM